MKIPSNSVFREEYEMNFDMEWWWGGGGIDKNISFRNI